MKRQWTPVTVLMVLAMVLLSTAVALGHAGEVHDEPQKTQKITVMMGEQGGRMWFRPAKIDLKAGVKAEVTLVNQGAVKHEWMLYDKPKTSGKPDHDWTMKASYLMGQAVSISAPGIDLATMGLMEVMLTPGKKLALSFTPETKGTFEMGCLLSDHWEKGMKGILVVQ